MKFACALVLLVIAGTGSVPLPHGTTNCAKECSGVNTKFRYTPRHSYEYRYETETKVNLVGTTNTETTIGMKAAVTITALTACEFRMRVSNVQVTGADQQSQPELTAELERHPLRFSFDDGVIREVCPDTQEKVWATNIKRGILSTFQNALEGADDNSELYESDVSGRCPTRYETKTEGDSKVIYRTKDLLACTEHRGNYTAIRGTPYTLRTSVQNMPLVDSDQKCRHSIRRHILTEASCVETHTFKPFRQQEKSGVISTTNQKLHFVSDQADSSAEIGHVGTRKTLKFDHSDLTHQEATEASHKSREYLTDLCQTSQDQVTAQTPEKFTELIYSMRKMAEADLLTLFQEASTNRRCTNEKRFFLDAIPMCNSEPCMKVLVTILQSGQLSEREVKIWTTSLAFVPKVTRPMVSAVLTVLDTVPTSGLLGISSMVHTYCKTTNPRCGETPEVRQIMTKLTQFVQSNCATTDSAMLDKVLMYLSAIGNIGHDQTAVQVLTTCLEEKTNQDEVRVAAIKALRRMPCDAQRQSLLNMYTNDKEEVEVRITAFVGLVRCADRATIERIDETLQTERSNQVGSFVWSYFTAIKRSSDPEKDSLKSLARIVRLPTKFQKDPRKFSRYYETSTFWQDANMGGHVEGEMIFSPDSFVPRQALMNLTVDMFGNSVNLLQIGARMEGVDDLLEKLFGPYGLYSNSMSYFMKKDQKSQKTGRIGQLHDSYTSKKNQIDQLAVSMYMKVFGDDLAYYSIRDQEVMQNIEDGLDVSSFLDKLAHQRHMKINKNVMFLDTTIVIPTVSGFPLRLGVTGTSSINLDISGKADFSKLLRGGRDAEILGHFKPSAAVQIVSTMAVHSGKSRSGVRMVSQLSTSTDVRASVHLQDGQIFKAKFELPKEKIEIINVQSQLFTVRNDDYVEEHGIRENRFDRNACTPERLNRFLGVKMCGSLSYPNASLVDSAPYFPLTGPARFALYLEKFDPTLTSYELTAYFKTTQNTRKGHVSFNTPGSNIDRELVGDFEYTPWRSLKVTMKSPIKELRFDGELTRTSETTNANLALTMDKTTKYEISGNLESQQLEHMVKRYNVRGSLNLPRQEPKTLHGVIEYSQPRHLKVDLTFDRINGQPGLLKMVYDKKVSGEMTNVVANGLLDFPWFHIKTDVQTEYNRDCGYANCGFNNRLNVEYRNPRTGSDIPKTFTWTKKANWQLTPEQAQIKVTTDLVNTMEPEYNLMAKYELMKTRSDLRHTLTTVTGPDPTSEARKLVLSHNSKNIQNWENQIHEFSLKCAKHQKDWKLTVDLQNQFPTNAKASLKATAAGETQWEAQMRMKNARNNEGNMELEFETSARYPSRDMRAMVKWDQRSPTQYKNLILLQWQTGKQMELESDLKWEPRTEYDIKSELRMPESQPLSMRKRLRMTPDAVKFAATATMGQRNMYNLKLDVIKESTERSQIKARVNIGETGKLDYRMDGTYESQSELNNIDLKVQKGTEDFARCHMIVPKSYKIADFEKTLRMTMHWDLAAAQPKNWLGEVKFVQTPEGRRYDTRLKVHTPEFNYQVKVHTLKNGAYRTNITVEKDGRHLIDTSIGLGHIGPMRSLRSLTLDGKIRTFEPLTPRHLTGMIGAQFDQETVQIRGDAEDHQAPGGKKAYSFDIHSGRDQQFTTGDKRVAKYSVRLTMPDSLWHGENSIETTMEGKRFKGVLNSGDSDKHYGYEMEYKTMPEGKYMGRVQLETPIPNWRSMEVKMHTNALRDTVHNHDLEILLNDQRMFRSHIKGNFGRSTKELTAKFETSNPRLSTIQLKYTCTPAQFMTTLDWNDVNQLHFETRTQGDLDSDYTRHSSFRAKVTGKPEVDAQMTTARKSSGEIFEIDARSKINGEEYQVTGQMNHRSPTATLTLKTPTTQMQRITFTCSQPGRCIATVERGADSPATAEIQWMWERNEKKLLAEVRNIQKPWSLRFHTRTEGGYLNIWAKKYELDYEVVTDLNNADMNTWAVKILKSDNQGKFRMQYPGRTVATRLKYDNQLPTSLLLESDFSFKEEDPSTMTKLYFAYNHRQAGVEMYEMSIANPVLTHDLKMTGRIQSSGDYRGGQYESHQTWKITYSDDDRKAYLVKSKVDWRSMERYSISGEIQHLASNYHVKPSFTLENRKAEVKLDFLNKNRENRQYMFSGEKVENGFKFEASCPENRYVMLLRTGTGRNELAAVVSKNDQPMTEINMKMDSEEKVIRLEIRDLSRSNTILHASARVLDRDTLTMKLWHTDPNEQKIQDAEFTMKIDHNDIFKTKVFVRPGLKEEMQFMPVFVNKDRMQQDLSDLYMSVISGESHVMSDLRTTLQPLFNQWIHELTAISREVRPSLTNANHYVRQYLEYFSDLARDVVTYYQKSIDDLMDSMTNEEVKKYYQQTKESMRNAWTQLKEMGSGWTRTLGESFTVVSDMYVALCESTRRTYNEMYEKLGVRDLTEYMQESWKNMQRIKIVRQMRNALYEMWQSLSDWNLQAVKDFYNDWYYAAQRRLSDSTYATREYFRTLYDRMMQIEDLKPALDMLNEIIEKVKWTINYYKPGDQADTLTQWMTKQARKFDLTNPETLKRYIPRMTVNDPANGRYEFETQLPTKVWSLEDLAHMLDVQTMTKHLNNLQDQWQDLQNVAGDSFLDTVHSYAPKSLDIKDMTPPYESVAFIVGDQHYITFDQTTYDFAGQCSYLLARDFQNGHFSVGVNYEKRNGRIRRKSVTVMADSDTVEILHDARVLVNDRETELPRHTGESGLSITRTDHKITVKSETGLEVTCDSFYHTCMFKLPGWRHADSAGLLGINDNEPDNDMFAPEDGTVAELEKMANQWHTSSSCHVTTNEADMNTIGEGHLMNNLCREHFQERSSPFRTCFGQVQPEAYLNMCLTDMYRQVTFNPEADNEQGLCNVSNAYVVACQMQGITLQMPTQCIKCQLNRRQLLNDETRRMENEGREKSADIVFIVEEKECLEMSNVPETFGTLAQVLETKLATEGVTDVKYGIVGFGGENVHGPPHFHTGNGKLNFKHNGLRLAARGLQFSSEGQMRAPMEAVQFTASNYPYRTGVKKIAILMKCTQCQDGDVDFYDVQTKVLERGMTLHVLQDEKIEFNEMPDKEIIGIDARSVYTIDDTEEVANKPDQRREVVRPHDACSVLAQESNGTVFDVTKFKDQASTRQFCQVFAERVSQHATAPHCQICECQSFERAPRTVCYPCDVPRPVSLLTSDSFFNIHYIKPLRKLKETAKKLSQTTWLF